MSSIKRFLLCLLAFSLSLDSWGASGPFGPDASDRPILRRQPSACAAVFERPALASAAGFSGHVELLLGRSLAMMDRWTSSQRRVYAGASPALVVVVAHSARARAMLLVAVAAAAAVGVKLFRRWRAGREIDRSLDDPAAVRRFLATIFDMPQDEPPANDPFDALADAIIAARSPFQLHDDALENLSNRITDALLSLPEGDRPHIMLEEMHLQSLFDPAPQTTFAFLQHRLLIPFGKLYVSGTGAARAQKHRVLQYWRHDVLLIPHATIVVDEPGDTQTHYSGGSRTIVFNASHYGRADFPSNFEHYFYEQYGQAVDHQLMSASGDERDSRPPVVVQGSELARRLRRAPPDAAHQIRSIAALYRFLVFLGDADVGLRMLTSIIFESALPRDPGRAFANRFMAGRVFDWLGYGWWRRRTVIFRPSKLGRDVDRWIAQGGWLQRRRQIADDMRRQLRLPVDGSDMPESGLRTLNPDGSVSEDPGVQRLRLEVAAAIARIIYGRRPSPPPAQRPSAPRPRQGIWEFLRRWVR
ncbi:MAG TPA: hypothetical protein VMU17_08270, partial [Elusimicrobiota bacterium]|nr:hypothetical protein [Elusimicrobiota bacterium]